MMANRDQNRNSRQDDSAGSRNSGGGRGGRGGGGRSGGRGGGGGPRNPRNQEPPRDRPREERGPRGEQQAKDSYYKDSKEGGGRSWPPPQYVLADVVGEVTKADIDRTTQGSDRVKR